MHLVNYDGGATVVRAPSIKEETTKVRTNASTVHEEFCFSCLKSCIWSVALYGSETWTLGKNEQRVVDAFETCSCTGILKIQWTDRITNGEVFQSAKEERLL
jgi:hypothetical protein